MAAIDNRSTRNAAKGGSSLLDVGLTADEAVTMFGAGSDPAWYVLGELEGGEIGDNTAADRRANEAGEHVTQTNATEQFEIGNTLLTTDDVTLDLLDLLSDGKLRPMRYPLPMGVDADGNRLYQLYYFPAAKVRQGAEADEHPGRPGAQAPVQGARLSDARRAAVRAQDRPPGRSGQLGRRLELDGAKDTRFSAA